MKIYIPKSQWQAKGPPKPLRKGQYAKAARLAKAWAKRGKAK